MIWSQICEKMALIVSKITQKNIVFLIGFKRDLLAVTHLLTKFTHVSRNLRVQKRKQKKFLRENCFENMVSALWKKNYVSTKVLLKKVQKLKTTKN